MLSHPNVFHLLIFSVSYAMVGITTGLALEGGGSPLAVVLIRMLLVAVLIFGYCRIAEVDLALSARDRNIACGIGLAMAVNNYTLNEALGRISVPLAILIFYSWPAITTVASWWMGKDVFRWRGLFGLVLVFIGLALTLNVEFTATETTGIWLAMVSACAWSATFLLVGHFFGGRDTRPMTFYMIVTSAVTLAIIMLFVRDFTLPSTGLGWGGLLSLPVFYAFGAIGIFAATVTMGPAKVGFYMNFEPVATLLLSALILGQKLAPMQLAGAALVIAALFLFRPLKASR